jgi:GTPase SAR1 family protein
VPKIVIFGPTGAGKSTVLMGFLHVMTNENLRVAYAPLDLSLWIDGRRLQHIDVPKQNPGPTKAGLFRKYRFQRKIDAPLNSRLGVTNSHEYDVEFPDFPGEVYQIAAESTVDNFKALIQRTGEIADAWYDLEEADGIIVLLDHTILLEDSKIDLSDIAKPFPGEESTQQLTSARPERIKFVTRKQYANMVGRLVLLSKTSKNHSPGKFVSICVNKIDRFPSQERRDAKAIIRSVFGKDMIESIGNIEDHFGQSNVECFSISAFGRVGGTPNWDEREWMSDPEQWEPIRVEYPFLWICEQVEKHSLANAIRRLWLLPHLPWLGQRYQKSIADLYQSYSSSYEQP